MGFQISIGGGVGKNPKIKKWGTQRYPSGVASPKLMIFWPYKKSLKLAYCRSELIKFFPFVTLIL